MIEKYSELFFVGSVTVIVSDLSGVPVSQAQVEFYTPDPKTGDYSGSPMQLNPTDDKGQTIVKFEPNSFNRFKINASHYATDNPSSIIFDFDPSNQYDNIKGNIINLSF